jgi:hypothetical protein
MNTASIELGQDVLDRHPSGTHRIHSLSPQLVERADISGRRIRLEVIGPGTSNPMMTYA